MRLSGRLMAVAVGDTCGSPWEFSPYKDLDLNGLREVMSFEYKEGHGKFGDITGTPLMKHRSPMAIKCPVIPNYTDDTVCTFALAEAILKEEDLAENLRARCLEDPVAGSCTPLGQGACRLPSLPSLYVVRLTSFFFF